MAKARDRLWLIGDGQCHYCRCVLERVEDATADHVVPRSIGGADALWNRVLACVSCDADKRDEPSGCACDKCTDAWRRWRAGEIRQTRDRHVLASLHISGWLESSWQALDETDSPYLRAAIEARVNTLEQVLTELGVELPPRSRRSTPARKRRRRDLPAYRKPLTQRPFEGLADALEAASG